MAFNAVLVLMEILFGPKRTIGPVLRSASSHRMGMMQLTIFLVTSPKLKMSITFPCMVDGVPVRDLCQERAWVFGKRVKGKAVNSENARLRSISQRLP